MLTVPSVVFVHGLTGHPRNTWTFDGVDEDAMDDEDTVPRNSPTFFQRLMSLAGGNIKSEAAVAPIGVFWPETVLKEDFPKLESSYMDMIRMCATACKHQ